MLCWFYKISISIALDNNGPLPPRVARHTARCAACHDFFYSQQVLVRRLVQDQPVSSEAFHRTLAESVLRRIEAAPLPLSVETQPRLERIRPFLAAAALLIVLLGGLLSIRLSRPDSQPAGLQFALQTCQSILVDDMLTLVPVHPALAQDDLFASPYTSETVALVADIQTGLNHILASVPLGTPATLVALD